MRQSIRHLIKQKQQVGTLVTECRHLASLDVNFNIRNFEHTVTQGQIIVPDVD